MIQDNNNIFKSLFAWENHPKLSPSEMVHSMDLVQHLSQHLFSLELQ